MGKHLKIGAIVLGIAFIFGCAAKDNGDARKEAGKNSVSVVFDDQVQGNDPVASKKLIKKAHSAIGTPYVFGGSEPGGFDCSGLVKWAYNSIGVELPRTAREQSVVGKNIKKVEDMQAGDIVAFKSRRGYHTGIYLGDGKFIHSPRKRTRVRINSLSDPYFKTTLLGARRVDLTGSENLIAQAESRLAVYAEDSSRMSVAAQNLKKVKAAKKSEIAKKDSRSAKKEVAHNDQKKTARNSKTKTDKKTVKNGKQDKAADKNAKAVAKKNGKDVKNVASNTKKAGKQEKGKTEASKRDVKANKKNDKAGSKVADNKKNSQKAVSMLQKKGKSPSRSRNRS